MSAMAVLCDDLTPDLTGDGLNILDTQATGVIDPVEVIKALMFRLILPGRHQHVSCYSSLIGFGLSRVSHEVPPPAPWNVMIIEPVVPECPAPWLGVDVVIGDPVIHG
jgi:hypothetical protein